MKTRQVSLFMIGLLFLLVASTCGPRPDDSLKIDNIIAFPFTAENIKNPSLTAGEITNATIGTTFALVGTGLSENLEENSLSFGDSTQTAWASSTNFAAFVLTSQPDSTTTKVTLKVDGETVTLDLASDPILPTVDNPDQVIEDYRNILTTRFLSDAAKQFVADHFPDEVVAKLEGLAGPLADFETRLPNFTEEDKQEYAALFQESGFNAFFEKNPPAADIVIPALVDVETVLAEIAIGAGIAASAKDDPPSASFNGVPSLFVEGATEMFSCTAEDDTTVSAGESGLKDITVNLVKGEGTLTPTSGVAQAASSDPFTVNITFTPKRTGRSRAGNITCRPTDGGGNIGTESLDFEISEVVRPNVDSLTIPGPDPKKKRVGQPFTLTIVASDKPTGPGEGVASGIDKYSFTYTRLSGPTEVDITPGEFPGPPSKAAGPENHTQPVDLTCTTVGAARVSVSVEDTAVNTGFGSASLVCVADVSFYQLDLPGLPDGDLVGSTAVALRDPEGAASEFNATFDVVDEETVTNEGGVLFISSGAGIDITLAEVATDPLFEAVRSLQVIADPELCSDDATYTFSVIDGPSLDTVTNDTSTGDVVGFIEADGIRMFRIEATSGQLCVTDIGVELGF